MGMCRLPEKLLTVLLALLLGLPPLQGALGGLIPTPNQGEELHRVAGMAADNLEMPAEQKTHDCEQSHSQGCCDGSTCFSSQCCSCIEVLFSSLGHPTAGFLQSCIRPTAEAFVGRPASSLYRPPRA